ncbi:MAG: phage regulatory protein/antirepressor Ant [Pseudomonadota bacterium]
MALDITEFGQQPLTMSSREVAELCEKRHPDVRRDVKAMVESLDGDVSKFAHIYLDGAGRNQQEYRLPKDLTLTLVAGYSVKLRKRIIDRWIELEEKAQAFDPATILESPAAMRGILLSYTEKVLELEAKNEEMREDVEAHELLVKADGSVSVTEAAKNLGMRPKDLFKWLSHNGWIYKRPGGVAWLGYQPRCNDGSLEHKTTVVMRADGTEKVTEQVRVTAKGLSKLAKLIKPTASLVA